MVERTHDGTARGPAPRTQVPLLILAGLALVYALKVTAFVTMPLAFATFIVVVAWPLHRFLGDHLPKPLGRILTLVVLLAGVGGITALLYVAFEGFVADLPSYAEMLREAERSLGAYLPGGMSLADGVGRMAPALASTLRGFAFRATIVVMTLTLTVLVVGEASDWRERVQTLAERHRPSLLTTLDHVADRFRRYMVVHTLVSLLIGVITGLAGWAAGIPDPLVWGVVAFLLNYIPNLGSFLAVLPPMLLAWSHHGWGSGLLMGFGLGASHFVIGQWMEPYVLGKSLRLSPVVVLLSVLLWGWVWGVGGALLSVPITVGLLALVEGHPRWGWIAELFANGTLRAEEEAEADRSEDGERDATLLGEATASRA